MCQVTPVPLQWCCLRWRVCSCRLAGPQGVAVLRRVAEARRADVMKKPSGPCLAATPATQDGLLLAVAACSAGRACGAPAFALSPLT